MQEEDSVCHDAGMDDRDAAELRILQQRAYGRGADIVDDPEARRRLAALEALRSAAMAAPVVAAPVVAAPVVGAPVAGAAPATAEVPAATAARESDRMIEGVPALLDAGGAAGAGRGPSSIGGDDTATDAETSATGIPPLVVPQRTPVFRRVMVGVAWVASLALVAAISATYTAITTARTAATAATIRDDTGITYVTTLLPDPDLEAPAMWSDESSTATRYDDFFGIGVLDSSVGWGGFGNACIMVASAETLETATENSFEGFTYGGCAAGAFPASAEFVLDDRYQSGWPDELTDRYEPGTALQFVRHDLGVDVFVSTPQPGEAEEP